jgi:hypothetical protein
LHFYEQLQVCTAQLSDKTDANNLDDIRNGDANHIKPTMTLTTTLSSTGLTTTTTTMTMSTPDQPTDVIATQHELASTSSVFNNDLPSIAMITTVFAMPATEQRPEDNTALIGGIVGGIIALLLIVGVIAYIVARKRKAKADTIDDGDGAHSLQPSPAPNSNYARVAVASEYDDVQDVRTNHHYDDVSDKLSL